MFVNSVVVENPSVGGYEVLWVSAVFMCLSLIAYWRTKRKGWLLSALGFGILFFSVISTLVTVILKVLSPEAPPNPSLGFIVSWLELCVSAIIIAVGWGLALKRQKKAVET